jgi:hypothetical protein
VRKAPRGLFASYPGLREDASCGSARPLWVVPPSFRNLWRASLGGFFALSVMHGRWERSGKVQPEPKSFSNPTNHNRGRPLGSLSNTSPICRAAIRQYDGPSLPVRCS